MSNTPNPVRQSEVKMAIVRVYDAEGWSVEDYDRVMDRLALGGHTAPGVLFNWCAATDAGLRIVDVYESRAVADDLSETKIQPLVAEMGLSPPVVTEYELHSYLTPGETLT